MQRSEKGVEPSMDEILASIRKLVTEEPVAKPQSDLATAQRQHFEPRFRAQPAAGPQNGSPAGAQQPVADRLGGAGRIEPSLGEPGTGGIGVRTVPERGAASASGAAADGDDQSATLLGRLRLAARGGPLGRDNGKDAGKSGAAEASAGGSGSVAAAATPEPVAEARPIAPAAGSGSSAAFPAAPAAFNGEGRPADEQPRQATTAARATGHRSDAAVAQDPSPPRGAGGMNVQPIPQPREAELTSGAASAAAKAGSSAPGPANAAVRPQSGPPPAAAVPASYRTDAAAAGPVDPASARSGGDKADRKAAPAMPAAVAPTLPADPPGANGAQVPEVRVPASAPVAPAMVGSRTLEDAVTEMLRPMLREWLDQNMPRMVERALKAELAGQRLASPTSDEQS